MTSDSSVKTVFCMHMSFCVFPVEVHIKKPLQPIHLSSEQVALEVLSLCCQLDLLIRAQVHQVRQASLISSLELRLYCYPGTDLVERMNQCLEHLPEPLPQLEDYLDVVGLSAMFPRVEIFIIHGRPVDMLERPSMDDYFPHIGKLNQLLVLSQQLEDDVQHLGSHKYIAHQLSVLYQVISSFKGVLPLSVLKRDIEANFKALKTSLVKEDASQQEPQLPAHYVSWILSVTRSVTASVSALPDELIEDLTPAMSFVMNLT
ncbi:UNVERIFIED_CONTAM: hypothetical protein FKN15_071458 [Acipenser sinensis]